MGIFNNNTKEILEGLQKPAWTKVETIGPAIVHITDDVCAKCRSQIETENQLKFKPSEILEKYQETICPSCKEKIEAEFGSNCEVHYGNIVTSICGLCKQQIADETLALKLENESLSEIIMRADKGLREGKGKFYTHDEIFPKENKNMNLCDNESDVEQCSPKCCHEEAKRIEAELKEKYLQERLDIENNLQTKITLLQLENKALKEMLVDREQETRQKCWEDLLVAFAAFDDEPDRIKRHLKEKWEAVK